MTGIPFEPLSLNLTLLTDHLYTQVARLVTFMHPGNLVMHPLVVTRSSYAVELGSMSWSSRTRASIL